MKTSRRTLFRTLFFTALSLTFFGTLRADEGKSETAKVGDVSLKIPPPQGMAALSRNSTAFKTTSLALGAGTRLEGYFYPAEVVERVEKGAAAAAAPFCQVQIIPRVESYRHSPADFKKFADGITREIGSSGKLKSSLSKELDSATDRVNSATGLDMKLQPGATQFFTPKMVSDRQMSFTFQLGIEVAGSNMEKHTTALTGTTATLLVRGKIIQLIAYAYGIEPKTISETQATAQKWADAVLAANPVQGEDEVSTVPASRSERLGQLVGMLLGVGIGVFLFRRFAKRKS